MSMQQKETQSYVCVWERGSTSWSKGSFNELRLELEVTTADMPQRKEGREGQKEAWRKRKKERGRVGGVSQGPQWRLSSIQTYFVKGGSCKTSWPKIKPQWNIIRNRCDYSFTLIINLLPSCKWGLNTGKGINFSAGVNTLCTSSCTSSLMDGLTSLCRFCFFASILWC